MRAWTIAIVSSVVLSACGSDRPGPREEKPEAPATNDAAYTISGAEPWWVIGNTATATDDVMTIRVVAPAGTDFIDAWVGDLPVVRLSEQADGSFGTLVTVTDLPAGTYDILLAANGSTTAFAAKPLYRSAPYYVLVSTDWDYSDPGDTANGYQDLMHRDHPELRITHFVGPYTFTDPVVSAARQQVLVTWLLKQRDTFKDEIGLHIHPYCNFVTHAGLTCVTDQSTVYATDDTGYTIKLGAYGRTNMGILLDHAASLFEEHGLNRPKTFRAGGWTATLETVQALADKGYVADTSALNWARIEEWNGKELYRWTMENWNPINDKSQPYWPGQTNVLQPVAPTMPILEVPDNGVMIDYVTLAEMQGLFDTNWNGQPISAPVTLMMGFHPATPGFSDALYQKVNNFLKYADLHLATRHLGPVVYTTLSGVVPAFAQL
ncbi:hypothetical protein BH11MYX3_BH11MYX3_12250 [soil metagenome]